MKHRTRGPGRLIVAAILLSSTLSATSGCSLFDFGRHDSFDEWYSGPEDAFDPESIGYTSLDGDFSGYIVNDVLIRTPALLVYETTRTALIPFAASCFACRHLFADDEEDAPDPEPSSGDDPAGDAVSVEESA